MTATGIGTLPSRRSQAPCSGRNSAVSHNTRRVPMGIGTLPSRRSQAPCSGRNSGVWYPQAQAGRRLCKVSEVASRCPYSHTIPTGKNQRCHARLALRNSSVPVHCRLPRAQPLRVSLIPQGNRHAIATCRRHRHIAAICRYARSVSTYEPRASMKPTYFCLQTGFRRADGSKMYFHFDLSLLPILGNVP